MEQKKCCCGKFLPAGEPNTNSKCPSCWAVYWIDKDGNYYFVGLPSWRYADIYKKLEEQGLIC